MANISVVSRRMDHPLRLDHRPQNLLRHHPRRITGNIVDPDKYLLHVRHLPHVPLGTGSAIRVQCRRLRQPEHVGADRQRRPVYASQEVLVERAHSAVPTKHSLHPLRPDVLYDQLPGRAGSCHTETTLSKPTRLATTPLWYDRLIVFPRAIGCESGCSPVLWRIDSYVSFVGSASISGGIGWNTRLREG